MNFYPNTKKYTRPWCALRLGTGDHTSERGLILDPKGRNQNYTVVSGPYGRSRKVRFELKMELTFWEKFLGNVNNINIKQTLISNVDISGPSLTPLIHPDTGVRCRLQDSHMVPVCYSSGILQTLGPEESDVIHRG